MKKPYFEEPEVVVCPNCGTLISPKNKLLKYNWIEYCQYCADKVDLYGNHEAMREGQKRGL